MRRLPVTLAAADEVTRIVVALSVDHLRRAFGGDSPGLDEVVDALGRGVRVVVPAPG